MQKEISNLEIQWLVGVKRGEEGLHDGMGVGKDRFWPPHPAFPFVNPVLATKMVV